VDYAGKYKKSLEQIKDRYELFDVPYNGTDNNDYVNGLGFCCTDNGTSKAPAFRAMQSNDNPEKLQYYYHSDHLGSSSLITDLDGNVAQHIEYIPFGEVFIEERNNTWNTPYKFNAKELDEETGLYYYGARYYDPRISIWYGADPLQEEYPNVSTYCYTANNPIKFVDPNGMWLETAWDVTSLVIGVKSFVSSVKAGNVGAAIVDGIGIVADAAAVVLPIVPGGAGAAIKGIRAADKAVDAAKVANKVDNAVDGAKAVKAVDKTAETSRAARRETMRAERIPTSQQPKSQSKNASGREYSYDVPKEGGGTQTKSVQQQTKDRSHSDQPHWEAGKVKKDDWGNTQTNSYGRPKLDNDKSKVNY
jgi:RHS repeat-associated protein